MKVYHTLSGQISESFDDYKERKKTYVEANELRNDKSKIEEKSKRKRKGRK